MHNLAIKDDPFRLSLIRHLLLSSSPAAVAGLIVAIVVDAIQRAPIRTFAHVGKEALE